MLDRILRILNLSCSNISTTPKLHHFLSFDILHHFTYGLKAGKGHKPNPAFLISPVCTFARLLAFEYDGIIRKECNAMFPKKRILYLTSEEKRTVLKSLIALKNSLIQQERHTDFVDELIIKFSK